MIVTSAVLLVFIFGYAGAYPRDSRDCSTPNKKNGKCVPVEDCPEMIKFLNSAPKPFSDELRKLINAYVCTYADDVAATKICCPSEPISLNANEEIPPPPNVLNHENLILLPEECGLIDSDDKIRGGKDAGLKEFPWMALLSFRTDNGPQFKCGGTIVNEKYILTAAHCVVNTPYPLISVRVGEYSLLNQTDCDDGDKCIPPPQDLTIEKIISHSEYNTASFVNDIALLRVSTINFDKGFIKTICLPIYEDILTQEFDSGVVTGWGFIDPYGIDVVDKMQRVDLNKRNMSVCVEAYKVQPAIKLSYKQLCVGGEGIKDSCGGDSGGPFHVAAHFNEEARYVQRGVVSIGHRFCGTAGFPGVYTNVIYYTKWILDNLKP